MVNFWEFKIIVWKSIRVELLQNEHGAFQNPSATNPSGISASSFDLFALVPGSIHAFGNEFLLTAVKGHNTVLKMGSFGLTPAHQNAQCCEMHERHPVGSESRHCCRQHCFVGALQSDRSCCGQPPPIDDPVQYCSKPAAE
jgi:hypothetical protein